LHPDVFTADKNVVRKYFNPDETYFIIRFAKLKAHHDSGVKGIDRDVALKLIELLKPHGKVYITAEREMEKEFEPYRLKIAPIDMHHVMAFADMYIGDSQTMAAEAGVLGVPFIRYNDFVGRIGYLRELEDVYKLGFGIKPENEALLLSTVSSLLMNGNRKSEWREKRERFLKDKINVTDFFVEVITKQ
jgi:predicted glycosyltransferase